MQRDAEKRRRISRGRSKTGCSICRARKIKCDETKPSCRNCVASGRVCDGPSGSQFVFKAEYEKAIQIRVGSVSPAPNSRKNGTERRSFDHFVRCAAPSLGALLDYRFWNEIVPRVAQTDDRVWDAAIALSSFYEYPVHRHIQCEYKEQSLIAHRNALRWYNRSLLATRGAISQTDTKAETSIALLSCLMFIGVELQQGHTANANRLMQMGYKVMAEAIQAGHSDLGEIGNAVMPVLAQYVVAGIVFGYEIPTEYRQGLLNLKNDSFTPQISELIDLKVRFFNLMYDTQVLMKRNLEPSRALEFQKSLLAKLEVWHEDIAKFLEQEAGNLAPLDLIPLMRLRVLYLSTFLQVSCFFDRTDMMYDSFPNKFSAILDAVEEVFLLICQHLGPSSAFVFEMGVVPSLNFVAWSCRHRAIRRRAVRLLQRSPGGEFSPANNVKKIVEKVIAFEEGIDAVGDIDPIEEDKLPSADRRLPMDRFTNLTKFPVDMPLPKELSPQELQILLQMYSKEPTSLGIKACRTFLGSVDGCEEPSLESQILQEQFDEESIDTESP